MESTKDDPRYQLQVYKDGLCKIPKGNYICAFDCSFIPPGTYVYHEGQLLTETKTYTVHPSVIKHNLVWLED